MTFLMNLDEERLAFHNQVAIAITQWTLIELLLTDIACDTFSPNDRDKFNAGVRSVMNFQTKLRIADQVMRACNLRPAVEARWAEVCAKLRDKVNRRNLLAHGWVLTDASRPTGRRVMLMPRLHVPSSSRVNPYPGHKCVRDIAGFEQEFVALLQALEDLRKCIHNKRKRLPAFPEPPPHPPTLADIRRSILAGASQPP